MPLSNNQLLHVCLVNDINNRCRYCEQDYSSYDWYCKKHCQAEKKRIDSAVKEYMDQTKNSTAQTAIAVSDNCVGYPIMKYIKQGYDI